MPLPSLRSLAVLLATSSPALGIGACGYSGLDVGDPAQSETSEGRGASSGDLASEDPTDEQSADGSARASDEFRWRSGNVESYEQPLLTDRRILFLHDEDPVGIDDSVLEHLFAHEAQVRTLGESSWNGEYVGAFDLVIVSSAKETELSAKRVANAPGPILILEPAVAEMLGFGEVVRSGESDSLWNALPDHALGMGHDEKVRVCDAAVSLPVNLAPDTVSKVFAHPGNSSEAVVFATEAGWKNDGVPLLGRVASTGLLRQEECMTETSWDIVDGMVLWLLEEEAGAP